MTDSRQRRVLVVGLGISGMATAIRLAEDGWTPVIVERNTRRRTGGYFVGLFPAGKVAAQRLGVLANMHLRTPAEHRTWMLDPGGRRKRSAGFLDQPGNPEAVMRGDIEAALWERVDGRIEVRFGTVPTAVRQAPETVRVTMRGAGRAAGRLAAGPRPAAPASRPLAAPTAPGPGGPYAVARRPRRVGAHRRAGLGRGRP